MHLNLLLIFILSGATVKCQKLYLVPHLINQLAGLTHLEKKGMAYADFSNYKSKLVPSLGLDVVLNKKKIAHIFSLEYAALGKSFIIKNKFSTPGNIQLGYQGWRDDLSLDYLVFNYSLRKERNKFNGFIFNSKIKFNYSGGVGWGINKSRLYYEDPMVSYQTDGGTDQWTYIGFESYNHRKGNGIFILGGGGFDVFNKRNKRVITLNLYYSQGLKQMESARINYQYGFWNDPQRQVDVKGVILKLRGTTYGFKIGVPVNLIK